MSKLRSGLAALLAALLGSSSAFAATDLPARGLAVTALARASQALNAGGGPIVVRTVTADDPGTPGIIALLPTDQVLIIALAVPHAVSVTFTCVPGYNKVVKDGLGLDATAGNAITLQPLGLNTSGTATTIDGQATFVENTSTAGNPPYDSRAIICNEQNNAFIY